MRFWLVNPFSSIKAPVEGLWRLESIRCINSRGTCWYRYRRRRNDRKRIYWKFYGMTVVRFAVLGAGAEEPECIEHTQGIIVYGRSGDRFVLGDRTFLIRRVGRLRLCVAEAARIGSGVVDIYRFLRVGGSDDC